jgi:hypothetical protein
LEELDFLTELFSFFTNFDASVSRQTCRWWNDLLSKDTLILNQLEKNDQLIDSQLSSKNLQILGLFGYLDLLTWYRTVNFPLKYYSSLRRTSLLLFNLPSSKKREAKDLTLRDCIIVSSNAARRGHLKLLKWFRDNKFEYGREICWDAVEGGHLKVVKWLRKLGLQILNAKERNGYHHEVFFVLDDKCCHEAAKHGHIHILAWFHEVFAKANYKGIWNWPLCISAASRNKLETLLFLRETGLSLGYGICAISKNYPRIQEYIHSFSEEETGCTCSRTLA